jgi:glycosyltransferase involved in cell wall biosynthesis
MVKKKGGKKKGGQKKKSGNKIIKKVVNQNDTPENLPVITGDNMGKYSLGIPLEDYPKVSVLTPTYNRSKFIPYLKRCFLHQTYPQEKMEWIIIDDGTEPVQELFADMPNVRYVFLDEKINIGQKRNMCNELATGDIMVCFDDDDYYPPTRVSSAVKALYNTEYQLAGASEIYMYYTDIGEIYKLGPYGPNHCTNGTMAYTRAYAESHQYDNFVTHAEESSFLNGYKNPCAQIKAEDVMLVMSHSMNTFDKKKMRNGNNKFVIKVKKKIEDFIDNEELLNFYRNA